ncbi:MAG: hypothetical protein DRO52_02490 [Candidatus Hecatellales archaeon]|nr:MAG: hypothetical protein DRO52_02490 [Candidatus Hecatellales archaeon]
MKGEPENVEALMREIEDLSLEILELREQRNRFNQEAKTWLRRGEALVDQAGQLKRELRSLKDEAAKLRARIRELKGKLEDVRRQLAEKRRVRDELKGRLRELKNRISISKGRAEKLFEELEWQIQTNPLSPEEERKLIERIKTLEGQLSIHGKIGSVVEELNSNFQDLQALKDQADEIRSQLDEVYSQLREKLSSIEEKSRRLEEAERGAREAYQKFTNAKVQADRLHSRIIEALNRQRSLKGSLREFRRSRELEAIEKLVEELKEAYKQGKKKKLTLEEFKLLMSRGLI